mmetsp:Transcript_7135/g.9978  ORF Transcript_7135/g.9978 Transcript_7135/m.9978 type:complete len:264 (+) Transcript_7135:1972-2763(+)
MIIVLLKKFLLRVVIILQVEIIMVFLNVSVQNFDVWPSVGMMKSLTLQQSFVNLIIMTAEQLTVANLAAVSVLLVSNIHLMILIMLLMLLIKMVMEKFRSENFYTLLRSEILFPTMMHWHACVIFCVRPQSLAASDQKKFWLDLIEMPRELLIKMIFVKPCASLTFHFLNMKSRKYLNALLVVQDDNTIFFFITTFFVHFYLLHELLLWVIIVKDHAHSAQLLLVDVTVDIIIIVAPISIIIVMKIEIRITVRNYSLFFLVLV